MPDRSGFLSVGAGGSTIICHDLCLERPPRTEMPMGLRAASARLPETKLKAWPDQRKRRPAEVEQLRQHWNTVRKDKATEDALL